MAGVQARGGTLVGPRERSGPVALRLAGFVGVEFVNTVDVFEGASAEANAQAYEAMGATIRARKP